MKVPIRSAILIVALAFSASRVWAQASFIDRTIENWQKVSQMDDDLEVIDIDLVAAMESALNDDKRYYKLALVAQATSDLRTRLVCFSGKLQIQRLITDPRYQKQSIEMTSRDTENLQKAIVKWTRYVERLPHGGLLQADVKILRRLSDALRRLSLQASLIGY
jgi:hypothetical protein